jgi:hypothetical protein
MLAYTWVEINKSKTGRYESEISILQAEYHFWPILIVPMRLPNRAYGVCSPRARSCLYAARGEKYVS